MEKDRIFSEVLTTVDEFKFTEKVAGVFPDMIKRSIPGYSSLVSAIGTIAASHAEDNTHIYDLGCSLGAVSVSVQHRLKNSGCRIIAVDNSAAMLSRARDFIELEDAHTPVELVCSDVQDLKLENASVVIMNFTLQFISPEQRNALIRKIWDSLIPGGIFILSEKINASESPWLDELHLQFKRDQGYSELEISQKRKALENVMLTDTSQQLRERLSSAGFSEIEQWFKCINFTSFLARR